MNKNDGGYAFPSPGVVMDNGRGETYQQGAYEGMTLRDYFATKALPIVKQMGTPYPTFDDIAFRAYELADAMIAERAK